MFLTKWNGIAVGWPEGEDAERFDIFRVADSTIVSHDELPNREALGLDWQLVE